MLSVKFYRVRPERLESLRSWLRELQTRRSEVIESFAQEGTGSEVAFLIQAVDGPVLVWTSEAADLEVAAKEYAASTLPVDLEHRDILREALSGRIHPECLFQVSR